MTLADDLIEAWLAADDPRPTCADVYCCEGGAGRGYAMAGFRVLGVDLFRSVDPKRGFTQGRYPYASVAMDALEFIARYGHRFDLVHTSPPCQAKSAGTRAMRAQGRSTHVQLIDVTREALQLSDKPYIIENVEGARDILKDPVMLCGTAEEFRLHATDTDGTPLEMWRHRLFESNLPLEGTECRHGWYSQQVAGSYGGARRDKVEARLVRGGGYVPSIAVQQELLGVTGMTQRGMHQCLPPVYTRHFGWQVRRML